jgi:hypothetical protein
VGARVVEDVVSDLEALAAQRIGERDHALVVRVAERNHAVVGEEVDDRGDLAARDEARRLDDVERLVQHHLLAFDELERIDVRVHVHAHLPPVDEDLRGAVLVGAGEDPVVVRRSAELVDLLLEELDLLLRFLQDAHEPLVLALGVGELLARQVIAAPHRLVLGEHAVEAAAELGRIGAEQSQRVAEIVDFVARRPRGIAVAGLRGISLGRRGGNAAHHVAYEALSTRPRIELAAHAVSSFGRPAPWVAPALHAVTASWMPRPTKA